MGSVRFALNVDLGRIRRNFERIKADLGGARALAVVKSDAYGLGLERVAQALAKTADMFGVVDVNEAARISGLGVPTMIFGALLPSETDAAVECGAILPVGDMASARLVSDAAVRMGVRAPVFAVVDTGMGRLGFDAETALDPLLDIAAMPGISLRGMYSHFPQASVMRDDFTIRQMSLLSQLAVRLRESNRAMEFVHIAASDGICNYPGSLAGEFNLARIGIVMYGVGGFGIPGLEPAVSMTSELAQVRRLPAGRSVGYGRTRILDRDTLVGTVAAGYASGMPLELSNRGSVIVRGRRCPILGRVSMDYTTVDLTELPTARPGDRVTLLGSDGNESIGVMDWVALTKTHAHDILCGISGRTPRNYIG